MLMSVFVVAEVVILSKLVIESRIVVFILLTAAVIQVPVLILVICNGDSGNRNINSSSYSF